MQQFSQEIKSIEIHIRIFSTQSDLSNLLFKKHVCLYGISWKVLRCQPHGNQFAAISTVLQPTSTRAINSRSQGFSLLFITTSKRKPIFLSSSSRILPEPAGQWILAEPDTGKCCTPCSPTGHPLPPAGRRSVHRAPATLGGTKPREHSKD